MNLFKGCGLGCLLAACVSVPISKAPAVGKDAKVAQVDTRLAREGEEAMEIWVEFFAVSHARGQAYTALRDKLLKSTPGVEERLKRYEQSKDTETALQARILLGWLRHREVYEQLLQSLQHEDVETAAKTALGLHGIRKKYIRLAQDTYRSMVLPLCWESLLKRSDELPEWQLVTMLKMVKAVPEPVSLEPLLDYLGRAPDFAMRRLAAEALQAIPKETVRERLQQERAKHQEISEMLDLALQDEE